MAGYLIGDKVVGYYSGQKQDIVNKNTNKVPRDLLGLLFCCHLTELHEGQVVIQGSHNTSYRYVLQFPKAQTEAELNY